MADNEILEEQRKARENFLQLKKMQQGEMKPDPKPSEVAVAPKTFKEKMQNYWFHFKWHTIGVVFLVVVISILTVQCATKEKYDYTAVLFAHEGCIDIQTEKLAEYLEKYTTDINGDGKVNVNIINCSFTEGGDRQYKSNMLTKVQTQIIGNKDSVIYVVDKRAYDYLQKTIEGGIFEGEPLVLDEEFYKFTENKDFGKLPDGLMLTLRRIKGTTFEKDEKAVKIYSECEKVLEKIKNK